MTPQLVYPHKQIASQLAIVAKAAPALIQPEATVTALVHLPGAQVWAADLLRCVPRDLRRVGHVHWPKGGADERPEPVWLIEPDHYRRTYVLLLTDAVATGGTVAALTRQLLAWGVLGVQPVALVDRPARRVGLERVPELDRLCAVLRHDGPEFLMGNGLTNGWGEHAQWPGLWIDTDEEPGAPPQ